MITNVNVFVSDPESPLITGTKFPEENLGLKYSIQKFTDKQYQEIFAGHYGPARLRIDTKNNTFAIYWRLDRTFSAAHAAYLICHESGHVLQFLKNRGLYFDSWKSIANPDDYFSGLFAIIEPIFKKYGTDDRIKLNDGAKDALYPAVRQYANIYEDLDVNFWLIHKEILPIEDYLEHLSNLATEWEVCQAEYSTASLESMWLSLCKKPRKERIGSMAGSVFGDAMSELGKRLVKLQPIFHHKHYERIEKDFIANQKKFLIDKFGRFACWDLIDYCWESLRKQELSRSRIDKSLKSLSNRVTLFVRNFVDTQGKYST